MGQLVPIDQRVFASRVGARNWAAHADLSRDEHRAVGADFDCADSGGDGAPRAGSAPRERSALERLLSPLDPVSAGNNAAVLLREFGSLGVLFNAAPEDIDRALCAAHGAQAHGVEAPGAGSIIAAAREFTQAALRQTVRGSPVRGDDPALHLYLQALLGPLPREQLHVVFADGYGGYIADEEFCDGGARTLAAHFPSMFRRAGRGTTSRRRSLEATCRTCRSRCS